MWYAMEKGLFASQGLSATLTLVDGGSTAMAALASGAVDICQIGVSNVVNAAAAGQDAILVAGLVNTMPYTLMVRPEIKTVQDLRGRPMGVATPGGATDLAMRAIVKKLGLEPDKDVPIVSVASQSDFITAMQTGAIYGALFVPPLTVKAREQGFHDLVDALDLNIPYPSTGIASTRAYVAAHHGESIAVLRALVEALAQMRKDETGTKEVLAKYLELDPQSDAVALDEAYQQFVKRYLEQRPYPPLDGLQAVITDTAVGNAKASSLTAQSLVDTTLLDELDKIGILPPKTP